MMTSEHQLLVIMFTDIVGYTAMMEADEEKAVEILNESISLQNEIIEKFKGKVVKELGDGLLCVFSSTINAVNAAVEIQKAVNESDLGLALKIALHSGEVIVKPNDVIGNDVNIGSRLETLAVANSIVISDKILAEIRNKGIETVHLGSFQFKNVSDPIVVYAIKSKGLSIPKPKDADIKGKRIKKINYKPILMLLAYFIFGWILLEFVKSIQETYYISLVWQDIVSILIISIIPSVIVTAFFSHRKKLTAYFIPSNAIVTLAILIIFSFGKPLGSYANKVEITNEKGQNETITAIKDDYRIKIGIAFFINALEVDSLFWLELAIADLIGIDLSYSDVFDIHISNDRSSDDISSVLKDSQLIGSSYYLLGSFKKEKELSVSYQLYDELGTMISIETVSEKSLPSVIDIISDQIIQKVNSRDQRLPIVNVPISQITTARYDALKYYYILNYGFYNRNINLTKYFDEALSGLHSSLKYDSTFIWAYWMLGKRDGQMGGIPYMQKAKRFFELGMPYRGKLKESDQILYLMDYYNTIDDERAVYLAEKIVELYPNNYYQTKGVFEVYLNENKYYDNLKKYVLDVYNQLDYKIKYEFFFNCAYQGDDELIVLIDEEIKNDPFNNDWLLLKALTLYSKKEFESATKILNDIKLVEPDKSDSLNQIIKSMENYDLIDLSGTYGWGGHSKRIYKNHYGIPIIVWGAYNDQHPCFIFSENEFFDLYSTNSLEYSNDGKIVGYLWSGSRLMYKENPELQSIGDNVKDKSLNLDEISERLNDLIIKYPNHHYLSEYQTHIKFRSSIDRVDSSVFGEYEHEHRIYKERDRIKYITARGIELELLPLTPTSFKDIYNYNDKFEIVRDEKTIYLSKLRYNRETKGYDVIGTYQKIN